MSKIKASSLASYSPHTPQVHTPPVFNNNKKSSRISEKSSLISIFTTVNSKPSRSPYKLRPKNDDGSGREQWSNKVEFLLSCIGYCVGLGNVWRFPYKAAKNGGGVFLIPYTIMLFFTGIPIFYLESAIGQYAGKGCIAIWEFLPFAKGIGWAMLIVMGFISITYNVVIGWSIYYFFASFVSPLPWSQDARIERLGNLTNQTGGEAQYFWYESTLRSGQSAGLHDIGSPIWHITLCNLLAWALVFLSLIHGIKSSGKVVYFTATFPYIVLIALFIFGILQDGAIDGIRWYMTPDWSQLKDSGVWISAATQIFYSLGIAVGGLLTMSSYNKFDNNFVLDTLYVTIGNCVTSVFAGFVIFGIIGNMAHQLGETDIGKIADSGPGLAFIAYPQALSMLPGSNFWSAMFFLMMVTLGMDSQHPGIETIVTGLTDEYPKLRPHSRKVLFGVCLVGFLLGLPMTAPGGYLWFELVDYYAADVGFLLVAFCMIIAIYWIYGNLANGFGMFESNTREMIGETNPILLWYYRICLWAVSPIFILGISIFFLTDFAHPTYGISFKLNEMAKNNPEFVNAPVSENVTKLVGGVNITTLQTTDKYTYEYPWWGDMFAAFINFCSIGTVVLYGLIYFLCNGWTASITPTSKWGPQTGHKPPMTPINIPQINAEPRLNLGFKMEQLDSPDYSHS